MPSSVKDMACLDHGCHKEVSISVEDLAKFPLVPPPPEQDYVKDPEGAEVGISLNSGPCLGPQVGTAPLLKRTLRGTVI